MEAYLLESNVVSPCGYVPLDEDAMRGATLMPKAKVLLGGKEVGVVTAVEFVEGDNKLKVKLEGEHLPKGTSHLLAYPLLSPDRVYCPRCRNTYGSGDEACDCIYRAPVTVLAGIVIESVLICDPKHDDISVSELRMKYLRLTLGSQVAKLRVLDPL